MNTLKPFLNVPDLHALWEKEVTLSRNEYLKVKGSTDTSVYYLVKGSLRMFFSDGMEEHIIRFGYEGELITALDSFISERPSDLYIQAIKKTQLKKMSKKSFIAFMNLPQHISFRIRMMEQLILQQMEREIDLLTASPKERYERVLARSPRLFQEIPRKYIASYLRMTPETLSRLKNS